MIAPSAWLQSRQAMWINRQNFLRDYVRRQGWSFPLSCHVSELWALISAGVKEFGEEILERDDFGALAKELMELTELAELEQQYLKPDNGLEPANVFVSPAVTVRRTAPNANKGGRGTKSGTGNKDPSDPDGDGDGDGDSSSILSQKQTSPRPQRGLERRSLSCKSILH